MSGSKDVELSVVVPVYNVEPYIEQCLQSLVCQTYKSMEIILVDDGSTDNSGVICDSYAKQYTNISVYHKVNGGLSSARNFGLDKAIGRYIGFVDSDDWVELDMYAVLMENALKSDADICMCKYRQYYTDYHQPEQVIMEKEDAVYYGDEVLLRLYTEFSACNKIYRLSLFDDVEYPVGKLYEDARTTYKLAEKARIAFITPSCLYNYRQRTTSIMGSFSTENYIERVAVWNEILEFAHNKFPEDEIIKIIMKKNKLVIELLMSIIRRNKFIENKSIVVELSSNLSRPLFNNSHLTWKEKCVAYFSIIISKFSAKRRKMI